MSIFEGIFGKSNSENNNKESIWKQLIDENQLDTIIQESNLKTIIIFKHSTRCGTSMVVKNRLEKILESQMFYDLYFLDLLRFRNISNLIVEKFDVMHQSPQLIIIEKGKVVENASHYNILNVDFKE